MARSDFPGAKPFLPEQLGQPSLKQAVQSCRGCDLYEPATQAVFGAGAPTSKLMLVGEQPGDAEDRAGEPFVGPAGRLLDSAMVAAGIDRTEVYVTNAVKHFRFHSDAGKRRIHQGLAQWQIAACQPWVLAELDLVHPLGVVLLGSTAGKSFREPKRAVRLLGGRPAESVGAALMRRTIDPVGIAEVNLGAWWGSRPGRDRVMMTTH